jgi:hypothetical protein
MPDTFTPYLNLCQPEVGGSTDSWGNKTNNDWTIVDTFAQNAANEIAAATQLANDAKSDAASVKGIADSANAKATQASADATQAKADAAAVKGIADDANAKATQASADATQAKADAAAVKGIADNANATAARAETTANQAKTDAATAQSTANTALQKANSAAQTNVSNSWQVAQTFPIVYASSFNFSNSTSSGLSLPSSNEVAINVNGAAAFVAQTDRTCRVGFNLVVGSKGSQPGGGVWADSSDIRTKKAETINPFPLGLDDLLSVRVKEYQFNGKYGTQDTGKTYVGFIADELLDTPFGAWCVSEVEWINPETGKPELVKQVDATAIIMACVNAHQTTHAITDNLQTEISPLQIAVKELREEMAALKAELAALKGGA